MASKLELLEAQIGDRFLANAFFANIDVHVDPQKNIVAEITRKIAQEKYLVAPFVMAAGVRNPDDPGPVLDPITIEVGVFVNPAYTISAAGAGGPTARDICEEIASQRGLHQWKPDCLSTVLLPDPAKCIEQLTDKALIAWVVRFYAMDVLTRLLDKLPTPVYDSGAGTITCSTPGAAVFYTTDGSNPGTSSTLALGNLGLAGGLTVKARAWLAGFQTSDLLTFTT